MAEKKAHLTILILQLCVSFTNKLTTIINQLIKPLANIYHPFCKADDGWANIGAFPKIRALMNADLLVMPERSYILRKRISSSHIEMIDEGFCI